jgi:adenylosuccinate synthase
MTRVIVLLSGPIAAGKTTLCEELVGRFGFTVFKTRELIQQLMQQVPSERGALQKAGESLDNKTKGEWIANSLAQKAQEMGATGNIVIDSVRIKKQIDGVRRAFGVHVHLRADDRVLEKRYNARRRRARIKELPSYDEARKDPTERGIDSLKAYTLLLSYRIGSNNVGSLREAFQEIGDCHFRKVSFL